VLSTQRFYRGNSRQERGSGFLAAAEWSEKVKTAIGLADAKVNGCSTNFLRYVARFATIWRAALFGNREKRFQFTQVLEQCQLLDRLERGSFCDVV